MIVRLETYAAIIAISVLLAEAAVAQTSPQPGPTAPSLPIPKRGDNLVINPTQDECRKGWRPGLKWTKKQFDAFCAQLKISK
jgi:hypothetical protein